MALDETTNGCLSLPAGADLSTKQYFLVKLNSSGQVVLAGAGEAAIGVLYSKPNAAGVIASVRPLDGRKALGLAGGSITAGSALKADSAGKLAAASASTVDTASTGIAADPVVGSHVVGYALEGASSGDVIQFLALAVGAVPTTAA